ncbi:MAG: Uma2 family endonuclease [Planctomycetia bacterium]|nr:Uma2 family endonuclease [Planctomycetia bacterium]
MATVLERVPRTLAKPLTLADLARMFGPMPAERVRHDPLPGLATSRDVAAIHNREKKLCELVDGVLVEKVMGYEESLLALEIGSLLKEFVRPRKLGAVAGEGGMLKLSPKLIRIPDVSFIARSRLPKGKPPRGTMPELVPNLAIEVLSKSNTASEMARKLVDYFETGVELVWYLDPSNRTIKVFTAPNKGVVLKGSQTLTGGKVLPGFKIKVDQIFSVLDEL